MAKIPGESPRPGPLIRWWLGLGIGLLGAAAILRVRFQGDWPFQKRNLITQQILAVTVVASLVWWTFFSRAPQRLRVRVTCGLGAVSLMGAVLFRLGGMSGDMAPILEFRWARSG